MKSYGFESLISALSLLTSFRPSQIHKKSRFQRLSQALLLCLFSLLWLGCNQDESISISENESTSSDDVMMDRNWWEEDGSDLNDSQTLSETPSSDSQGNREAGSNDEGKPDYEDKPDYGDKPNEGEALISGIFNFAEETGTLTYSYSENGQELCSLVYALSIPTEVDGCTQCNQAWSFEISFESLNDSSENMKCASLQEVIEDDTLMYFGHQDTLIAEYAGTSYYQLYTSKDDSDWMKSGYSILEEDRWEFGIKNGF